VGVEEEVPVRRPELELDPLAELLQAELPQVAGLLLLTDLVPLLDLVLAAYSGRGSTGVVLLVALLEATIVLVL